MRTWRHAVQLFSLCLVMLLAACNSNNSQQATDNSTGKASASKTTLHYWTSARHDAEYMKEMIDEFNRTNTDHIEVVFTGLSENYSQALEVAFASGQAPDVLQVFDAPTYVLKNFVAPLDDYMTEEMKEKFGSAIVDNINRFGGKIYSLPAYGYTYRLIYNAEIFEKAGIPSPPKTMDELVRYAKQITEMGKKDGVYGFALNFKNAKSAFDRSVRQILPVSGYHGLGYDVQSGRFDFAPYARAVEYFKQMYEEGSMMPGVESLDIDPLRAQFAEGKIGMYFSFSVEPGVYSDQFPTDIDWRAAEAPSLDGTQKGLSDMLGGYWIGMSPDSKHKEAAWKFMNYMYSDKVMQGYHERGLGLSMIPSVMKAAKDPEVNGIEGFIPTERDGLWPPAPIVTPEGLNYGDVFFKYMISGGNKEEIVQDLNNRYNQALDKGIARGDVTIQADPAFSPSSFLKSK